MQSIARINIDLKGYNDKEKSFANIKVTSEHIYIKPRSDQGWIYISLKETKLTTTLKGTPLLPIRGHTKEILYNPKNASLAVDLLPATLKEVIPTELRCEKGRPLVYKVHNINQ
jgi:hypothetical protein